MEKTTFKTLVRADHKLGGKSYVFGRISGIQYVVCDTGCLYTKERLLSGTGRNEFGNILKTVCTAEEYEKFATIVEEQYPGLCVFNYED